jgi:serine/arginine repetitive matrix protein 2
MANTPTAGPSRPYVDLTNDYINDSDNESGAGTTPRVPRNSTLPLLSGTHVSGSDITPADTPAARLRALLSRVPNQSSSANVPEKPPPPPSELDSDFETPHFSPITPSIARESLKDLFSHALRDPGDTPQKRRRRRNSIDASEVEASPRVERERAKYKTKRQSLSDDEVDKPSSTWSVAFISCSQRNSSLGSRSESSFRSSHAATYDSLRLRLMNSHENAKTTKSTASTYTYPSTRTLNLTYGTM